MGIPFTINRIYFAHTTIFESSEVGDIFPLYLFDIMPSVERLLQYAD